MEMLSYADVFNAHSLLEPCCDILRQHGDLIGTDRFKNFLKDHSDMAHDVGSKSLFANGGRTSIKALL